MQHLAGHDLELLESYIHDCVQQLPNVAGASPHKLPQRCSAYHASVSAMLRQILKVLDPLSPRICHLLSQVWDLTSLNFFVLIQLAQTSIDGKDSFQAKWWQVQRFYEEATAQHAARTGKLETDLEHVRLESQELRAELQKTRHKANRLAVENAQLRKAVNGLMEVNASLSNRMNGEAGDQGIGSGGVSSGMGDAEEWELYGVNAEQLDQMDVVHPIESYAQDFDQLFEGLFEKEREQMALLNEMDRFMNSNVVALLWRHGPDEDQTKFLQQMMSKRTVASQTEDHELGILNDDDDFGEADAQYEGDADVNSSLASGETGTATVVTKRQLLPPSLRAQLTTRPRIQRVLEKDQLSRVILYLLLNKMDHDAALLRKQQPRTQLHRFMKEFFLQRYGIATLAEYHMMELVKSVLYYHEKAEAEVRRQRQLTGASSQSPPQNQLIGMAPMAALVAGVTDTEFSLLPGHDIQLLAPEDLRLAMFARLCELVPLQWKESQLAPVGGNLFACATNALLDFLGDVLELDRSCSCLHDALDRGSSKYSSPWEISLDIAGTLVAHHFSSVEASRHQLILERLRAAAMNGGEAASSPLALVSVDALLIFFTTQWLELDQRLTTKLHDTFHREVTRYQSESHRDGAGGSDSHMGLFKHIWQTVPGDHFSPLELNDLEAAFATILELRHSQQQQQQQRRISIKRQSIITATGPSRSRPGSAAVGASPGSTLGLCVGGVSEKEFVFQTQQVLRARRVCRGMRTNGRAVVDPATGTCLGPRGRVLENSLTHISMDELKVGVDSDNGN